MPSHIPANESLEALQKAAPVILIVDDSPSNQLLMELYFKDSGCTVDYAFDGNQALEMFGQRHYDLVIMDIQMPEMDGWETTRRLRDMDMENASTVPVLAVTANAMEENIRLSLDAGCTDFLAKPVSKASLLDCVAHHILLKS